MTIWITATVISLFLIFVGGFELLGGTVILCAVPVALVVIWRVVA